MASGESRRLDLPGTSDGRFDLSWSPDDTRIAYVAAQNRTASVTQVWTLDLEHAQATPFTDGRSKTWSPIWSRHGDALFVVSNRGGAMDLWHQRIGPDGAPVGNARPVTTGIGMRRAALSPDGTKLAYSDGRRIANLWRVPILRERPASWDDAEQLTFDQALISSINISSDGNTLAFNSDRTGNPDLWTMSAAGGEMQQVTSDPTSDWSPSWSPDDSELVFYAFRSGTRHLWVMPATGGPARQLTDTDAEDYYPRWSPDGREVVFHSLRSGNMDVWVIPVDGGEARQITDHPRGDFSPQWSADGKSLVFTSTRTGSGSPTLWKVAASGGPAEKLTDGPAWYSVFSPDGAHVYFVGFGDKAGSLWEVPAGGGAARRVTKLEGKPGGLGNAALATDGKHLYFAWEEDLGDIWVMDVVTDEEK